MNEIETAHLQAGAALLALIDDVVAHGGLGCDPSNVTAVVDAIATFSALVALQEIEAHLDRGLLHVDQVDIPATPPPPQEDP